MIMLRLRSTLLKNLCAGEEISWSCWRGVRIGLCALGTGMFILVVATVVLVRTVFEN